MAGMHSPRPCRTVPVHGAHAGLDLAVIGRGIDVTS